MTCAYAPELEAWWLREAGRVTGCSGATATLLALEAAAARLSELFTTDRPAAFGDYAADARAAAVYGLFFFPQTYGRVRAVLPEWAAWAASGPPPAPAPRPFRLLDLGAGTGAATAAVCRELADRQPDRPVEATAVDHSAAALRLLAALHADNQALWPRARLTTVAADARRWSPPNGVRYDLVVACFAANEMFPAGADAPLAAWVTGQLARLAPGGALLVIEPAGPATSVRLQRLRDRLAAAGAARLLAPCLHTRPCPLLAAGGGFCHDVRRWPVPESVAYLNRRLFRTLHDLKFSFLLLARPDAPAGLAGAAPGAVTCRLVAPMYKGKGVLRTAGCCADGTSQALEVPQRRLDRPALDRLLALERGDVVTLRNPAPLADGRTLRAEDLERATHSCRRPTS